MLGTYPPARAILQILSCISLLAAFEEFPLIIRETVEMETPASFAISFNVIEQEALKEGYIVKYSFSTFDIHNPATQNQIINNEVDGAAILGRCDKETLKFMKLLNRKTIQTDQFLWRLTGDVEVVRQLWENI